MAQITPFPGLRYDQSQVKLDQAVTQPYDKITPAMREAYYAASPYNLVRIILGKQEPDDSTANNPYTRAAAFFSTWRQQGILRQDAEPSLYLYCQKFLIPGTKTETERRGFIALGKLHDYSEQVVFRHEQTLSKPKADRLDLLRATRAHFGQIFMLYSDPGREIDALLSQERAPDMQAKDEYDVLHRAWKISDPKLVASVQERMRDKKLIIADGHHRYETALNYRNELRAAAEKAGTPGGADSPYDYAMMTFVNMDTDLVILPTHRVVHGLHEFFGGDFRDNARKYFNVREVNPDFDAAGATAILREAGKSGTALLAVTANRAFILDHPKPGDGSFFAGLSSRQQSLDVVQLHKVLLEGVLGLSEESIRNQQNITYLRDAGEALAMVHRGAANVAFLMNPASMNQVRDISFAGEVLPQKSTDFYPKLLSGLAIYALE